MTRHPDEHLARCVAWAFLAAEEWSRPALSAAGAHALGRRQRRLGRVVAAVVAAYRVPPLDRPDELGGFLLASTPLAEAAGRARRRGTPVEVRAIPTVAGRMGPRRWPVPAIDDLAQLARLLDLPLDQLSWAADVRGLQRRTPAGPLHLFRYRWLDRPGRVPRLLEAPTPLLRAVLRRVLEQILVWVPVHPAAHGFVRGRSATTHAGEHVGSDTVLCLDLRNFFAAVTAGRVNGMFRAMGYPEPVAETLTGLCTHRTPVHVLARMPAGGDSTARHRLRAALRARHLPQGSPTSPALANLACFGLDRRLAGLASVAELTYTRYADDVAFSGPSVEAARLVRSVTSIAAAEGFAINPTKTRVQSSGRRQLVTGLVTNERLSVPREYVDQLRAVLHDAGRNGPDVANRAGHPDFRAHLDGRIGWVEAANPARGRRLRAQFDAIAWPA